MSHTQFCCLIYGAPRKLLPSLKEAVADSLPKHVRFGQILLSTVTMSMKEAVDGSTWIQPTIAASQWNILVCVLDNMCTWVQ